MVARTGFDQSPAVNKEALLAHIHSRLECLPRDGGQPTPENGWLATPGEPVNLADYGLEAEPQAFNFAIWRETPNPAFGGRTPQQVINEGTEAERNHLADAVDAIAALLDGAFS